MKKILLLFLFVCSAATFGANVYFDYPNSNSQPFILYDSGNGIQRANVEYRILTVSVYYVVDIYQARVQHPDGSWTAWQEGQTGGWVFDQAGSYKIEGRVHVTGYAGASADFWMYSTTPVPFTILDLQPKNLSLSPFSDSYQEMTLLWGQSGDNANYIRYYEVYREDIDGGSGWQMIGTIGGAWTIYCDVQYYYATAGNVTVKYKVRARSWSNNFYNSELYSAFSTEASAQAEPNFKRNGGDNNESEPLPTEYAIAQNYPNPFNPNTNISYELPKSGLVTIKVYDILGKEVAELVNEYKEAGKYSVRFDASNLSTGIYIYRIQADDFISIKKMNFVK